MHERRFERCLILHFTKARFIGEIYKLMTKLMAMSRLQESDLIGVFGYGLYESDWVLPVGVIVIKRNT